MQFGCLYRKMVDESNIMVDATEICDEDLPVRGYECQPGYAQG